MKSFSFSRESLSRSSLTFAFTFALAVALFALALATAGCAADSPPASATAADSTATPVLSFNADWSITQSGPLFAGSPAILHYDFARLPRCRATQDGVPAWNLSALYNADGGNGHEAVLTKIAGGALTPIDATITVPYGHDLAVWFQNSDDHGCSDWDSDYGRNFHFAIQSSGPVIHFNRDWTIVVDGQLAAGGTVAIDYDLARAPYCRASYNGNQTWDVLADYRFDGGAIAQASLTTVDSLNFRVSSPARLQIPANAHSLEVWFENNDRSGCHQYESNYGRNYSFAF